MALINRSTWTPLGDRNNPLNTFQVFYGTATTRAAVLADVDTAKGQFPCGIGSTYFSSAGKQYVKVSQTSPPNLLDWQRVTTTAAD